MWIWIKFYPCPHRPDARRLCQNYSTIRVDMDKIGFIHIHTDEVRAVCVKIIDLPIWIWIKFYPCPHRREARRSCQKFTKLGRHRHTIWRFHMHLLWAAGGLHAFHLLYRWRHPPRRPALSPAPFGTAGVEMGGVLQSSYGLRQHATVVGNPARFSSLFTWGPGGSFSPSPTTQEQPSPYFPRLSSFCSHFLLVALSSLLSMPGLQTFWSSLPIIRSQCSARPAFSDLSHSDYLFSYISYGAAFVQTLHS